MVEPPVVDAALFAAVTITTNGEWANGQPGADEDQRGRRERQAHGGDPL